MNESTKVREGYEWATAWFNSIEELLAVPLPQGKAFAVELDGLVYACQFTKFPGARRLVVSLNGSTGPTMTRPVMIRRNWAPDLESHMLIISDPSLFLDPNLRTGVFLGTEAKDPMEGVLAISTAVAKSLRLDAKHTVYWGSSSGGFAALMAASRTGSAAVALNPQLDLPTAQHAQDAGIICNTVRPGLTPEQLGFEFPLRVSVGTALDEALEKGLNPRMVIMQNIKDKHHFTQHFVPFCLSFNANSAGGIDPTGRIATYVYEDARGHRSETAEIKAHLKATLGFLTGTEAVPPPPPAFEPTPVAAE